MPSSVSTEATATAEPTETTVDPDLIEERIAEGTKAMKTATPELKAKIKQTTLSQRLNPSESGAATLARYRAELERRAALTQGERAAEDAVRERLRKQQAKGSKGPHREPESGPRKDRGHEL
ncbi:hypothetical protein BJF84_17265 [Rhodococcus sp. CUA-806]|nr:hypothetical protein BJF84_17265 [Rhodococcus sp. CUA-806]